MLRSIIHSFTNLRGSNTSTTMPKAMRFAGICRMDWSKNGGNQNGNKHFTAIFDKNIDSPTHPLLDNC
jgi:hypothetical protein